jgi:hypothetical protein
MSIRRIWIRRIQRDPFYKDFDVSKLSTYTSNFAIFLSEIKYLVSISEKKVEIKKVLI